ncbi:MAG: hypothetical protein IPK26_01950 [Planctomycetes bacterium]|nr:hypothetical protein [Planctomycetota bacterium]
MSKSLYAIGGLGLGSCLVMSLMMQHLLKVKTERHRSPIAIELEEVFASRLTGPVEVKLPNGDADRTIVVTLPVLAGLQKQKLATTAGNMVWRRMAGEKDAPAALRVEVKDDSGGKPEAFEVPKPVWPTAGAGRTSPGAGKQPAAGGGVAPAPASGTVAPAGPAAPGPGDKPAATTAGSPPAAGSGG